MTAPSPSRYDVTRAELAALLEDWGEPAYRVAQVWDALYRAARPLEEATALPRALRYRASQTCVTRYDGSPQSSSKAARSVRPTP